MANLTRGGVCYDLKTTPFTYTIADLTFCFSSLAHQRKFERELYKKRDWLDDSLSRRFKVRCSTGLLGAFQLYQQVETRGFLVRNVNEWIDNPERVVFYFRFDVEEGACQDSIGLPDGLIG